MAGDVVNIKVCSPLKLRIGLTGNCHAICHYSYNLTLAHIVKRHSPAPARLKRVASRNILKNRNNLMSRNYILKLFILSVVLW